MIRKIFIYTLLLIGFLSFLIGISYAYEETVVVEDDGGVFLVPDATGVLGATTQPSSAPSVTKHEESKSQPASPPPAPEKATPLAPVHSNTIVQVNPPINNDKRVQVIISTQTPSAPQPTSENSPHPSSAAAPSTPTVSTVTKTVDKVIATSSLGKPVIVISSQKAHSLTISQNNAQATTTLPLQIDTLNHSLSIPSPNQSATINVLPFEAMQGIKNTGLITSTNIKGAQLNLSRGSTGITYSLHSTKQGRLFGVFPIASPVEVTLSAQNGEVVQVTQPLVLHLFGGFIK